MLAQDNEPIKKAVGRLKELSADELTRIQAEAYEKSARDNRNRMRHNRDLGIAEGIELGKEQAARSMIAEGCDLEFIARITGLDFDVITRLKNEA